MRWGVRRKRTAGSVKKARTDKGNKTASKTVARSEKKVSVRKEKVKQALLKQVKKLPNHADEVQAGIAGLAMYGISTKVWRLNVPTSAIISGFLASSILERNKESN